MVNHLILRQQSFFRFHKRYKDLTYGIPKIPLKRSPKNLLKRSEGFVSKHRTESLSLSTRSEGLPKKDPKLLFVKNLPEDLPED